MTRLRDFISRSNILIVLIFSIFLIESIATLYLEYSSDRSTRIVGIYKFCFILVLLLFLNIKKLEQKNVILVVALGFLLLINQFVLNPILIKNIEQNLLYGSLYYGYRFLYVFLFIIIFSTVKDYIKVTSKVLKLVEYLLFFNAFLIIIGSITDLDLLASYSRSTRFGSDGMFNKVNETSYLYIIYIASLYYKYINKKKGLVKLFFIILVSFLLGTKTVILFLVMLLGVHIFLVSSLHKYLKIALGIVTVLGVLFFEKIAILYFKSIPFWNNLLEKHSVTTLLFSKRDYLFQKNLEYVDANWSPLNYFVGGPYYSEQFFITQMDGPDIFLFFGAIGTILYLFFIYRNYFIYQKLTFNVLIVLILICGLLSGGLFLSVMSMVYLYMFSVLNRKKRTL